MNENMNNRDKKPTVEICVDLKTVEYMTEYLAREMRYVIYISLINTVLISIILIFK